MLLRLVLMSVFDGELPFREIERRTRTDIDYMYNKTVWTIVREKLDLNYEKPFIKYSTRPEDAEKHLKKNLENINLQKEILIILDETACQNTPNTSRILYESGTKNTIAKIPNRIKINMIEYQSILINLFEDKFYEIIESKSFYENWLEVNDIKLEIHNFNTGQL